SLRMALVDEGEGLVGNLLVDRLHALLGERTGVLDLLSAFAVGPAVEHAPGAEPLLERRIARVVRLLRVLLGMEVIEIAEELVEAVHRRKKFVLVTKMVFAELACGVTQGFQQFRDRRVLGRKAQIRARHPDLGEARSDRVLAGDKRGAPGRAALLSIVIGEGRTLMSDPGDVRRPVAPFAAIVEADGPTADIVAPKD